MKLRLSAFVALAFFSCSNPQMNNVSFPTDVDTLKKDIATQSSVVEWTDEIEGNALSERKKADDTRFGGTKMSVPMAAAALCPSVDELVYPALRGFGSIDISLLDQNLRRKVDEFCSALLGYYEKRGVAEHPVDLYEYMRPERNFMLTIFLYDTANLPVFQRYVLGKPLVSGDECHVPVRFFSGEGTMDIDLYLAESDDGWKINQIKYGAFEHE